MLSFVLPRIKKTHSETQKNQSKVKVSHQNKIVLVDYENILYVKTERPYIALVTKERTYLHNSTLKEFIGNVSDNFVQIHKSTLINKDYIHSYKSRQNGDYDVLLLNGDTLRVSRNFNANFKSYTKVSA
jgi:DNA-binding LytR/AlgR family response regulator